MKRFLTVIIILSALAAGLLIAYRETRPEPAAEAPARPVISDDGPETVTDPPPPEALTATTTPLAEEQIETAVAHEEKKTVEPVPYLPPPSLNLTGSTLGRQRLPGTEGIGDVMQLYYHKERLELLMTVLEPAGLRSVWRLDQNGRLERAYVASGGAGDIFIHGDSKGNVYVQHDNPARLYRTTDNFRTWLEVSVEPPTKFWGVADDGRGALFGTSHDRNTAVLYRSTDDGFNWKPFVDFQKIYPEDAVRYDQADDRFRLRHLHGVIYDQLTNRILVGTGDAARFTAESRDGGKTWKKIWDEGFTASAPVGRGVRYLLCPDRLRAAGLALYDAEKGPAKTVWLPAAYNFAGYCYSVINVGGTFYAAFHTEANEAQSIVPKFGIIVSPDAETWYPFLEWGPLTNHARTNIWLAQGPNIIYASVNGALYAFRPLEKGWFMDKQPFR